MDGSPNRRNKAAFCDRLVWTEGLTVEIKQPFFISAVQQNIHVISKCVLLLKESIDKSM